MAEFAQKGPNPQQTATTPERAASRQATILSVEPTLADGEADALPDLLNGSPRVQALRQLKRALNGRSDALQRKGEKKVENRTGLPDGLKSGVESLSGVSMDSVNVHYNSSQPAQLNALAYAQGTDIHLAPGQERHLPHEAWHVVQQAQGRVRPTLQMKSGVDVNDDAALEHEADVMGARALARGGELGAAPAALPESGPARTSSPSSSAESPVQRLIGFEIESRIPVYQVNGGVTNMNYDTLHANAGTGDGSELGVDKVGETSIIEFASGPVSDTQSAGDFRDTARSWVNVLRDLKAEAVSGPFPKQLNAHYAPAANDVHFGKLNAGSSVLDYEKVAIQATHGLQLEKVKDFINKTELENPGGFGRVTKKNAALDETKPNTEGIMTALKTLVDPATVIPGRSQRSQALKEAEGFFALIAHYLTLGGKDITAYLKNQTTLFYKSKLSDVRNNIMGNRWIYDLVHYADTRAQVATELLTGTARNGGDPLFRGSVVDCDTWLAAVLSGSGDPFFEEAKNDWGKPIDPGKVKGKNAVVLEHRDLANEMPFPDNLSLNNPDAVVTYLVSFFKLNKKRQGL